MSENKKTKEIFRSFVFLFSDSLSDYARSQYEKGSGNANYRNKTD